MGRDQISVPSERAKTGGKGLDKRKSYFSAKRRGGARDLVGEKEEAPQEPERDYGLVSVPRRNRALIPRTEGTSSTNWEMIQSIPNAFPP